jgi:hypothetical protein
VVVLQAWRPAAASELEDRLDGAEQGAGLVA